MLVSTAASRMKQDTKARGARGGVLSSLSAFPLPIYFFLNTPSVTIKTSDEHRSDSAGALVRTAFLRCQLLYRRDRHDLRRRSPHTTHERPCSPRWWTPLRRSRSSGDVDHLEFYTKHTNPLPASDCGYK
ncbi:hypothetical protein ARMGADRAFT_188572 [Armillaria gallica]|uniref:Uncharacterized protein n=1 Tax=Armillaria gallica TaxID=47427 RepID=A0A2H3DWH9_ARMGA|nr:hypothetical protein ARMGADRAFT_188572 [Armillaria gallica]